MQLHPLQDDLGKIIYILSQQVRAGSRSIRFQIPKEYLKLFDLKKGEKFSVLVEINSGGIYLQPQKRIPKVKKEILTPVEAEIVQRNEKARINQKRRKKLFLDSNL